MLKGIDRIKIAGFKSLKEVDLSLGPLNILVGSNGAGKSNFLSLFKLLNALTEEGLQLWVGRQGGAGALLHYGPKTTPRITLELFFRSDVGMNTYHADLVFVAPDALMFSDEAVEFHPAGKNPQKYDLSGGHRESRLDSTIVAAGPSGKVAQFIKFRLDRWRSYHFHDTSETAAVKQGGDLQDNRYLRSDAGNLAAFLYMLKQSHASCFAQIRDTVRMAFPMFDDFVLEPLRLDPHRILLGWREVGSTHEFGAHQLSDGTLRFICLAALLLQPFDHQNAPYSITIDEPELGLHPYAVNLLSSLLRSASQKVQLVVSTQSASLVSATNDPSAVVVVDRKERASTLKRVDVDEVSHWLEDYTLGDIWEKGILGGRPQA